MANTRIFWSSLVAISIVVGWFFLITFFVQLAYNHAVPRILVAANPEMRNENDAVKRYGKINYWTAMTLTILVSLLSNKNWLEIWQKQS